jgi:hypothetical protein
LADLGETKIPPLIRRVVPRSGIRNLTIEPPFSRPMTSPTGIRLALVAFARLRTLFADKRANKRRERAGREQLNFETTHSELKQ